MARPLVGCHGYGLRLRLFTDWGRDFGGLGPSAQNRLRS